MATTTQSEVPYENEDVTGNVRKAELVKMVARQADKWPGPDVYSAKSTGIKRLRKVLLDPEYQFTKLQVYTSPERSPSPVSEHENRDELHPETDEIDDNASVGQDPDFSLHSRRIKLLIQDTRGRTAAKTSQEITVSAIETHDEDSDKPLAELHEILVMLQESNSAIIGPVRISCRDPEDPEYWMPFVKVTDDALLEEAHTDPEFIAIPSNSRLEILVENSEDVYFHAPPQFLAAAPTANTGGSGTFNVNDPHAKPLEHARRRPATRFDKSDADTDWLKEQLENTEGYDEFKSKQRRVQTNPGVVKQWKFIADFCDKHMKQPSRIPRRKRIQKKSIIAAFGLGSSTIGEAEKATRILKTYGAEGTNPSQAVIERVSLEEDRPKGAAVLYPFLCKWYKDHN
ncbi:hypothetical protein DFH06DRAFT_1323783 [Mycena polygramma]|nr:hypothetical protein DFH06DRAFT_1323783 [Mycena polygramma]